MLATTAFILVVRIVMAMQSQANPFYTLASQLMQVRNNGLHFAAMRARSIHTPQVVTRILGNFLGTWLTSMIGDDTSNDKLLVGPSAASADRVFFCSPLTK